MAKIELPLDDDDENWMNKLREEHGPNPEPDDAEEDGDAVSEPEDGSDDDQIAEIVAQYKVGDLPFDQALEQLAATSLTWHEAQILLGDEDGDGVPDAAEPSDPTAPKLSDFRPKP